MTVFRTGRGKEIRDFEVHACFEAIGAKHAKALLGFHTFTGCDQTGFNGKSKSSWWKVFLEADDNILGALSMLGDGEVLPTLVTL